MWSGKWAEYFEAVFLFTWAYICFTFEGLFFGYSGDCFTLGLQMGLKRPGRALFSGVWPFYDWVDGILLYDDVNGCVAVFLCLFSNMMP